MINNKTTHATPNSQSRGSKFLKDFGVYSIGILGVKLITFLLVPLYTHFIKDPAEYGYWELCLTFCMIATPAASTQLRDGVFRFLLGENSEKTKEKVLNYVYHQLGINISIVLLISLLVFTLTDIAYQWQSIGLLLTMALYEVYAQTVRGLGSNKLFVINGLLGTFAETPVKSLPVNAFLRDAALIMSLPPPMFAEIPSNACDKYAPMSAVKSVFTLPSFCALSERLAEHDANPNNTNK